MSSVVAVLLAALFWAAAGDCATVTVPGAYPTVQAAIDGAPSGSVIQLVPGRYVERLLVASVGRTLTIRGDVSAPAQYVLDAGGADNTLRVIATGSNVSFEGVTITGGAGGYDGYGGGLFMADSQAIFRNCVFTGNSARIDGGGALLLRSGGLFESCVFDGNRAGRFGGGVLMNLGTSTLFDGCVFTNNEAGTTDIVDGWGGGVHVNASSPLLRRCVIEGNRSRYAAGGISATAFDGPPTLITLEDCTIANNTVLQGSLAMPPPEGGGMHIENDARAVLRRCHVHDNTASRGGGLNNYRAHYEISDSVIEDNTAAVVGSGGGTGGGVYAQSASASTPGPAATVVMTNSVVRRNTADVGGGFFVEGDFTGMTTNQGVLDLTGVLIADNHAASRAGGLFIDRTVATIRSSFLLANDIAASADSWGGGLAAVGSSTTAIDGSTLARNVAKEMGGGVFVEQGGSLQIRNSRFWDNEAGTAPFGGNGIAIGQQPGPTAGPTTGEVSATTFDDAGQGGVLWESNCDLSHYSAVLYRDNVVHNTNGPIYYRNCGGATPTVGAFNALGSSKASNNVDAAADFVTFLATPSNLPAGAPGVLSWCAPGSPGLSIDGGVGALGSVCGTVDVSPGATTTYSLSSGGTPVASARTGIPCSGPRSSLPLRPANGAVRSAGTVTLAWAPATGASTYDVYADTSAQPTTLVAADVQATTIDLRDVQPGLRYQWQVVAKDSTCSTPSPVYAFDTCDGDVCEFTDDFNDGDFAGWTTSGKGSATVADGRLQVKAKGRLTLFPPAPTVGNGSLSVSLELQRGRREIHLMFGHRDARNYGELTIRGAKGQLRIMQMVGKRRRKLATTRHAFAAGKAANLMLDINGTSVRVLMDGEQVLAGILSAPIQGKFGIQAVSTTLAVDDVHIRLN